MNKKYYLIEFILNGCRRFLIWYSVEDDSNKPDEIVLDSNQKIVVFQTREDVSAYIEFSKMGNLLHGAYVYNFDNLLFWLENPAKDKIDCVAFLNCWNLFSDLATSIAGKQTYIDNNEETTIYDKLFWGSNLSATTPPGEHFIPAWSNDELRRLFSVLNCGVKLFHRALPKIYD